MKTVYKYPLKFKALVYELTLPKDSTIEETEMVKIGGIWTGKEIPSDWKIQKHLASIQTTFDLVYHFFILN